MISVIIPTYNAEKYLPALIERLAIQTIKHELIVIDSESTDLTTQILKDYNITVYSIPKSSFNHGTTRNLGARLAKHNILLYLTQDALPVNSHSLEKLVSMLLSHQDIAIAYGRQLPYPEASELSRFARFNNYPDQSILKSMASVPKLGIKACHCSNSFAAYRRDLLLSVGGFPSDIILGEDVTVAARLILSGKTLAYCANSEVYHSHNYTLIQEFRRYFDIGVFHKQQKKLLSKFSSVENEGISYVLNEWRYLIKKKHFLLIPEQLLKTLAKYIGYKLGLLHENIPIKVKIVLSMHSLFWNSSTKEQN